MAAVTVTDDMVDIRFGAGERLWTGRERLTIPIAGVRRASVVSEPVRLARGARRGLAVSGFLKIGVWGLFGGTRQLVSARRGQPGLHLILERSTSGGEFDEVLISHPAAAGIAEAIGRTAAART